MSTFNKTKADREWARRLLESEIMRVVVYAKGGIRQSEIERQVKWMDHWPKRPDMRYTLDRLVQAGALARNLHSHGYIRSWIYRPAWRKKAEFGTAAVGGSEKNSGSVSEANSA